MAQKTVMAANSVVSEGIKRETIVNELMRRLSNICRNQPQTQANITIAVNDYVVTMKRSGYSEKILRETEVSVFKGFENKLKQAAEEGTPIHRH